MCFETTAQPPLPPIAGGAGSAGSDHVVLEASEDIRVSVAPAATVAQAYVRSVTGGETGQVIEP